MSTDENSICFMCTGTLSNPRTLPCRHKFCLDCLEKSFGSSKSDDVLCECEKHCPRCFSSFEVPSGGLEALEDEGIYAGLRDKSSTTLPRTCDTCFAGASSTLCEECDQYYCRKCALIHSTISSSKSHLTKEIGFGAELEIVDMSESANQLNIEVYCEDCQELVPLKTFAMLHCKHKMQLLSELVVKKKLELERLIDQYHNVTKDITQGFQQIKSKLVMSEYQASQVKEQVNQRCKLLKRLIEVHADKAIKEIDSSLNLYKKKCESLNEKLRNFELSSNENISYLEHEVKNVENKDSLLIDVDIKIKNVPMCSIFVEPFILNFEKPMKENTLIVNEAFGILQKGLSTSMSEFQVQSPKNFHPHSIMKKKDKKLNQKDLSTGVSVVPTSSSSATPAGFNFGDSLRRIVTPVSSVTTASLSTSTVTTFSFGSGLINQIPGSGLRKNFT